MRKLRTITAGLIAGTLLSGTASATTNAELEQRIAELEQMVRLLSRKQEVSEEVYVADKTRAATNGTVKAGPDGFALVSPDGNVVWLCVPRLDSPALFADLLGGPVAGFFEIRDRSRNF